MGENTEQKNAEYGHFCAVLHVTIELMKLNGINFNPKHITVEEVKIKCTSFLQWAYLHQRN